ncbi:MAG: site-specific integrase [Leptolyngbyaceae cyanobacterium bins.302]|nr:site-specific integrase [Leptolyngbyaceae cyanobacterium bins.302]
MSSKNERLTKRFIDEVVYQGNGKSSHTVFDHDVPGLALRTFPSGRKSFVLKYRFERRQRWYTIGRYGDLTLDEARRNAQKIRARLFDGQDPLEKRRESRDVILFSELALEFMNRHSKPRKRSWTEDQRRIDKFLLPEWKNIAAQKITRSQVSLLHSQLGRKSHYESNRVLSLISVIFECGKKWGLLSEQFVNPAKGIEKFKEKERDRWLLPEELRKLAVAIDMHENIYVRASIWLFLLTGVRKMELLRAKWEHINFQRQELRLPETKNGGSHYISLSQTAINLIRGIPRNSDNPYLLPGKKQNHHLVNISLPWKKIRAQAGIKDVRLHDLRRTCGSYLAQSGNSLQLIGKVLNHRDISTTMIYSRLSENQLKNTMEDHSRKIMSIVGRENLLSSYSSEDEEKIS